MSTTTTFVAVLGPAFVTLITFVYVVPATTLPGPTFNTIMSVTGVTPVTTGGMLMLLVRFGSALVEVTDAEFVILPPTDVITVKVTLVFAVLASVPKFQLTTPAMFVPLLLALTKTTLGGNASLTTTLVAAAGPAFVTVIV